MFTPNHIARVKEKNAVRISVRDVKYMSIPIGSTADDVAEALGQFADDHPEWELTATRRNPHTGHLELTFRS